MNRYVLALLATLLTTQCWATELLPWYGRDLEIEWRNTLGYETYKRLDTESGKVHRPSDNTFYEMSFASCYDRWAAEVEFQFSNTNLRTFSFEDFRFTGRYQILDDVIGDPVSLVVGLTLIAPTTHALHDYNVIYHGHFEAELHLAVGKEYAPCADWIWRWWFVGLIGQAERDDSWAGGKLAWEGNLCQTHFLRLFADGLYGLGVQELSLYLPFPGYGHISHGNVDVGVRYTYALCNYGTLSAQYTHRAYAKNLPLAVNGVMLQYCYPFGL